MKIQKQQIQVFMMVNTKNSIVILCFLSHIATELGAFFFLRPIAYKKQINISLLFIDN